MRDFLVSVSIIMTAESPQAAAEQFARHLAVESGGMVYDVNAMDGTGTVPVDLYSLNV